jgi:DNA mismatch endonuclease (patch repair protein)
MTTTPKTNTGFWVAKFARNVARDRAVQTELQRRGYDVLVVWECETESRLRLARRVEKFVRRQARSH